MIHIAITLVLTAFAIAGLESSEPLYRFVPITKTSVHKFKHELMVTFDRACHEKFVKVIREEQSEFSKKEIAVGVLVRMNPLSSCIGKMVEETVNAGPLYSGIEHSVNLIKTEPLIKIQK